MNQTKSEIEKLCQKLHEEAIQANQDFYIDPKTGYLVSTQVRLKRQKVCCQSGCRHCPYGFQAKTQGNSGDR
ncbi:MAG: DUF5522 domain-containing protein [Bdellovibrionia bacterium]